MNSFGLINNEKFTIRVGIKKKNVSPDPNKAVT